MPCIANFTAAVSADCSTLTLTDTSTAAYNGETINSRNFNYTDSQGNLIVLPFPRVAGVGDTITVSLLKDIVYDMVMTLVPSITQGGSVYTNEQIIASVCNGIKYRDSVIKAELLTRDTKNVLSLPDNLIQKLGALNNYILAVSEFSKAKDLVATQQALDLLTSMATELVNNSIS